MDSVVVLCGILRLRMLAVPAGGDLGGQVMEKAILTYRSTESAPIHSRMQYVTHRDLLKVF